MEIVNVLILLANLQILAVVVKIYTEINKKEQMKRIGKPDV
jgi:hypothetical protein